MSSRPKAICRARAEAAARHATLPAYARVRWRRQQRSPSWIGVGRGILILAGTTDRANCTVDGSEQLDLVEVGRVMGTEKGGRRRREIRRARHHHERSDVREYGKGRKPVRQPRRLPPARERGEHVGLIRSDKRRLCG